MQIDCKNKLIAIGRPTFRRPGFTLVELLVVIGIIGLLISILLPVLGAANRSARRAKCLANIRSMQIAQAFYCNDNRGYLIQANLAHGGAVHGTAVPWIEALQRYAATPILARCPGDTSVHFEDIGVPVPPSSAANPQWRRTSYGINNFLDRDLVPYGGPYVKITQIRRSSATAQFLEMARAGEFAGADHPHVENWGSPIPAHQYPSAISPGRAGKQIELHAHGGRPFAWDGRANYGFIDGHAETARFEDVYRGSSSNRFDPAIAQ